MEISVKRKLLYLAIGLVVLGVLMRLLPHIPNIAPVGAVALFGGAVLPSRYAWWLPLAIMVASDMLLGFYDGLLFNWAAFVAVGVIGMLLARFNTSQRIVFGVLGGGLAFYIISNFGVWLQGGLYAHTWTGLVECYTMALPFLRNTLVGDLLYSSLLFGAYAMAQRGWQTTVAEKPTAA
ncbi:MAG TPA: DUF6580 family putative transport protein [Candidatus Saccharimonadales bacterium]|nr:DUF6580 family putative transport protein [Candidatus Saccharimonadales bacterium]